MKRANLPAAPGTTIHRPKSRGTSRLYNLYSLYSVLSTAHTSWCTTSEFDNLDDYRWLTGEEAAEVLPEHAGGDEPALKVAKELRKKLGPRRARLRRTEFIPFKPPRTE